MKILKEITQSKIASNDLLGAINLMMLSVNRTDSELQMELIIQSRRLKDLESRYRSGLLSHNDVDLSKNQIAFALLEINNKIIEDKKEVIFLENLNFDDRRAENSIEKPIRMHPAFLSHSSKDKPFATKLYEALIKRNVLVWYDERKLLPGDNLIEGISKGIDLYDKFILVCSKQSLQESWWVDKELNRALDKEMRLFKEKGRQINTIIPITIDDYVFKEWDGAKRSDIHRYNIGDFTGWQDDAKFELALDKLVAALNADRGGEEVVSYL